MILIIDNYDSFTYNLVQYFGELGGNMRVIRNDELTVSEITSSIKPDKIVISPGPGTPDNAGVSLDLIEKLAGEIPILGVCLGHQAIGQIFGADVVRAPEPVHGKSSRIKHTGEGLFASIPNPFDVGRYHSLVVDRGTLPETLSITAETDDGMIMGLKHSEFEIYGVQFHPESILTANGKKLLLNFMSI